MTLVLKKIPAIKYKPGDQLVWTGSSSRFLSGIQGHSRGLTLRGHNPGDQEQTRSEQQGSPVEVGLEDRVCKGLG